MNILLLGSSGLIGAAVHTKLRATAHTVIAPTSTELDFQRPDTWDAWLQQADALVNCVGVMSADNDLMQAVQCSAPQTLYQQAKRAGMGYVLQVSALGASVDADTVFLRSKGQLDAWLLASGLIVGILRPSLVFAKTGRSSRLFVSLAKLPHLWLPEAGHMAIQPLTIQPVALNDVATAVVAMLQSHYSGVVNAVGGRGAEFGCLPDFAATTRLATGACTHTRLACFLGEACSGSVATCQLRFDHACQHRHVA